MRRKLVFACVVGLTVSLLSASPGLAQRSGSTPSATVTRSDRTAASASEWYSYQYGPFHRSDAVGDPSISPATVASLTPAWTFHADAATGSGQPVASFNASPVVVNGVVYIGSKTGIFTALRVRDGSVQWRARLDYGSNTGCPAKGTTGTANIATDPTTGALTVYAPGAHFLYALDAATGAVRWKTAIGPNTAAGEANWYNWSSPTIEAGKLYAGLGANCDAKKIRGGEVQLDQHTGKVLHTWYAVPAGTIGPTVWSSAAVSGTSVWVTTGNPDPSAKSLYDAVSIVRLSTSTMARQDKWTAPFPVNEDLDFGSSPTLFSATLNGVNTAMVGACNKNGVYYAWKANALSAGPVWQDTVGKSAGTGPPGDCITSAAYDPTAKALWVAANQTTIAGQALQGAVREVNPATGAVIWAQPLGCVPYGSPTLNGTTHVLAVPLFGCTGTAKPGVALFNSQTGTPLRTITTAGLVFSQPVFAEGGLFIADESGTLTEYTPAP
jgi:outer membrane protein assembly factor BamB